MPMYLLSSYSCFPTSSNNSHLPLMEHSWENWPLNADPLCDAEKDLAGQCNTIIEDEEFLRNILVQQPRVSNSESDESTQLSLVQKSGSNSLSSSNEMEGSVRSRKRLRPPRTYILSFDKSTIIPATSYEVCTPSKKRNLEQKPMGSNEGGKKTRSDSQIMDHIMAERKRRQDLSQKFIALSATIPGLKKTDKSSILREAINYVKVLQERVRELEERNKKSRKESTTILKNTNLCGNEDTTSSETNFEDYCESLPVVKAKMLENEVLIEIHCEKENGIELKIMDLLENLHLFVTGSSVLPFGNSTFGITIIAQMGELYKMVVNDLVETLRRVLMNRTIRN